MNRKKWIIIITVILLLLSNVDVASAVTSPAFQYENLAIILVIDNSGSMEKTDPQMLRDIAANVFIDLLSPQDYLGVITFNTEATTAFPISKIGSNQNKTKIKEDLRKKINAQGDTNYQLALAEAGRNLDALQNNDIKKVIVFLTDGKPDPDPTKLSDAAYMENYMNTMWKTVSDIASDGFPVYTIGFSQDINPEILRTISMETQGEYLGVQDSAGLASSLFQILNKLKNRKAFLDTELFIRGNKNLTFDFDGNTSQVTLVLTHMTDNPPGVALVPPKGFSGDSDVNTSINKADKYTILTLNQADGEASGTWSVSLNGEGIIKAFGSKDSFVKLWLKKPVPNSIVNFGSPVEIETEITGTDNEKLYVEAKLKKNGIPEPFPVMLKKDGGLYSGRFGEANQIGDYDIEVSVFQGKDLIGSNSFRFVVKETPVLETDFHSNSQGYLQGKSITATSWLEVNGRRLKPSPELAVEDFQIRLLSKDISDVSFPLLDNGNNENGDILSKDGVFSSRIKLDKPGIMKAVLTARGSYKGESFRLEKPLGQLHVFSPGSIGIKLDADQLFGKAGDIIEIPLSLNSSSPFDEVVVLSSDNAIGKFMDNQILVKAQSTTKIKVPFQLFDNQKKGDKEVSVRFFIQDPLTKLQKNQMQVELEIVSGTGWIMKKVIRIVIMIMPFLLLPLIVIMIGLFLNRLLVYPGTIVKGILTCFETCDPQGTRKELKLKSLRKGTVVISLNDTGKDNGLKIFSGKQPYNLILVSQYEQGKWKFIDGYKALFKKGRMANLKARTTEPGIIQYNGQIYTEKEIFHGDVFETGGYTFQYLESRKSNQSNDVSCRDLLEGKI